MKQPSCFISCSRSINTTNHQPPTMSSPVIRDWCTCPCLVLSVIVLDYAAVSHKLSFGMVLCYLYIGVMFAFVAIINVTRMRCFFFYTINIAITVPAFLMMTGGSSLCSDRDYCHNLYDMVLWRFVLVLFLYLFSNPSPCE